MANLTKQRLHVVYGDSGLGLHGPDFDYLFSYVHGGPTALKAHGHEWLYRAPKPAFWRATTDNDRGSGFSTKAAMWLGADQFATCDHVAVSVDDHPFDAVPTAPRNDQFSNQESADTATVTYTYRTPTTPVATVDIQYTVAATGVITVGVHYQGQSGLPSLPALGLRFVMPTAATGFTYTGLAGETYPDRCAGAKPGTYAITGLPVTPYLVPQECGMHIQSQSVTVTRNTTLNPNQPQGTPFALKFDQVDQPFAFSCLPYTALELESATHQNELPPRHRTVLTIYGAVRGVGGIDSWGTDVDSNYHIDATGAIDFAFEICPL
ncbi:beta-galactosidase small subunit [Lactiplantibacillus fabifermentans]|uniref:beta-galactosidase n=2 Tax=Lactiplantibacillus fabifermentans TaxID=483011 RepID=A0A0R2P3P1_9LACO|nr:beta-galactosidase small subunit [Lactiplantibacillus fabifermentans]ETY75376.1 beta-galactosidase [Lactiplantibacillus fabifermentans T30PCM01]KRO29530.1 Beta-galactosidase [Lactiplantibacillus fabifermentans DSM 21115]